MDVYRIQTNIKKIFEVRNHAGNLVDPSGLTFSVRKPDSSVETIPMSDPRVTRVSEGIYQLVIELNMQGTWSINAQSYDPTVSITQEVYCDSRH